MIRFHALALGCICTFVLATSSATAQFFYTGLAGGDFFDELNWTSNSDGTGSNPTAGAIDPGSTILESLIIDGDTVSAAGPGDLDLGGVLDIQSGSQLDVSDGELRIFGGGTIDIDGATINITDGSSGQFDADPNSQVSILNSFVTASDDIIFEGSVSVVGSTVESTGDDIEWQDTATVLAIDDSSFTVADGTGSVSPQIIRWQVPATISDSDFSGGRISVETPADLAVTDSTFVMVGDIEDAFNAVSFATITLNGTSSIQADQLEEGVTVVLRDTASLSFVDDDLEGEWITNPDPNNFPGVNSSVVFESADASVSFTGPQDPTDDDTQIFIRAQDGTLISYAAQPLAYTPNNWNAQDDVTISPNNIPLPEPGSFLLTSIAFVSLLARRKR